MQQQQQDAQEQVLLGFGSNYFRALGNESSSKVLHLRHEPPSSAGCTEHVQNHDENDDDNGSNNHTDEQAAVDQQATIKTQQLNLSLMLENSSYDKDRVEQVVCSATSSLFRTKSGKVYQVGTLHGRQWPSPTQVSIQLPLKCVQIAAGRHFCLGLLEGGVGVVSWGAGHFGQLGLDPADHGVISESTQPQLLPRLLPRNLHNEPIVAISAGTWHAAALLQNGRCWLWGSNRHGQCTAIRPKTSSSSSASHHHPPTVVVPTPLNTHLKFSQISCGKFHTVALEQGTGRVYAWGSNLFGQCCGCSSNTSPSSSRRSSRTISSSSGVKLVESIQRVVMVQVRAGDLHTLALTGGGRVFAWGCGLDGQLGVLVNGSVLPKSRPRLVTDLDFVAIAANEQKRRIQEQEVMIAAKERQQEKSNHTNHGGIQKAASSQNALTTAVDTTESSNTTTTTSDEDTATSTPNSSTTDHHHYLSLIPRIVSIEASGNHSIAVSSSGHVYAWGGNDAGMLGLPTPEDLPFFDPFVPQEEQSTVPNERPLEVRSFDAQHNVWLPRRMDALTSPYFVEGVAVGTGHVWCWGKKRDNDVSNSNNNRVGKTRYELHQEQARSMVRLRSQLSSQYEFRSSSMGETTTDDDTTSNYVDMGISPASTQDTLANESMTTTASTTTTGGGMGLPETARPCTPKKGNDDDDDDEDVLILPTTLEETTPTKPVNPSPAASAVGDAGTATPRRSTPSRRLSLSKLIKKLKPKQTHQAVSENDTSMTKSRTLDGKGRKSVRKSKSR